MERPDEHFHKLQEGQRMTSCKYYQKLTYITFNETKYTRKQGIRSRSPILGEEF